MTCKLLALFERSTRGGGEALFIPPPRCAVCSKHTVSVCHKLEPIVEERAEFPHGAVEFEVNPTGIVLWALAARRNGLLCLFFVSSSSSSSSSSREWAKRGMQIELQEFPSSAGTPNTYGGGLQGEVTKSVQLHALESAFNFPCAKGFFTVCGSKL